MADKLMYTPNAVNKITPFVDNNQYLKRLDNHFNGNNDQNSIKVLKANEQETLL